MPVSKLMGIVNEWFGSDEIYTRIMDFIYSRQIPGLEWN